MIVGVSDTLVVGAALLMGAAVTSRKLVPHPIEIWCAAEAYVFARGCEALLL